MDAYPAGASVLSFLPCRGRLKRGEKEVGSKLITTERRFNVCLPVSTLFALFLHCIHVAKDKTCTYTKRSCYFFVDRTPCMAMICTVIWPSVTTSASILQDGSTQLLGWQRIDCRVQQLYHSARTSSYNGSDEIFCCSNGCGGFIWNPCINGRVTLRQMVVPYMPCICF